MATSTQGPAFTSPAPSGDEFAPVTIISLHRNHQVILEPADDWYDQRGSRRTRDRGVKLDFSAYRYTITDQRTLDLLMEHPEFTGFGAKKSLWLEQDVSAIPAQENLNVRAGVQVSGPAAPQPPVLGWDELPVETIQELLESRQVDPYRAIAWERANRNRGIVRRMIGQAIVDAEDSVPARAGDREPVFNQKELDPPAPPDTFGSATGGEL